MGQFFSRCSRSSAPVVPIDAHEDEETVAERPQEELGDLPQGLQMETMADLFARFDNEPDVEGSLLAERDQAQLTSKLEKEQPYYVEALAPKIIESSASFRKAYEDLKILEKDHRPRTIDNYRAYFPVDRSGSLRDDFIHFRRLDQRPELHEAEPLYQTPGLAIHISIYDPLPAKDTQDPNFINGVFLTTLTLMHFGITRFKIIANHSRARLDSDSLQQSKIVTIYLKEEEKYLLESFREHFGLPRKIEKENELAYFKPRLQEFWKTVLTTLFDMLASHRIKWGAQIRTDLPIISNTKYAYWRHQAAPRHVVIDTQKLLMRFAGGMKGFEKLYLDRLEVYTRYPIDGLSSTDLREPRDSDSEGSETIEGTQKLLGSNELIRKWPFHRG